MQVDINTVKEYDKIQVTNNSERIRVPDICNFTDGTEWLV
jgi:hypothetical protein